MKTLWNMLRGRTRKDNRGLTFVETLCAVAIVALVTTVIGTVIVVSTRTYRKGISETGIQQEAQLAANNIGNIVKDACSVVYGESGQQYLENGEDLMLNDDTTPKMQVDGTTELSIITNEKIQYTVMYQRTDPADPHGRLFYQEFDAKTGNPNSDLQIMASNIVEFSADTTDFKKSKTIKLKMTVEDEATNRQIPMEYTMTSRNDAVEGAEYVSHTDSVYILFPDGDIVLVPGETYQIPIVVAGKLTAGGLEWESAGGLTTGALTLDYAEVTVPVNTTERTETIVVHTKDKDDEGNYKATASCNVIIRRVERVEVTHVTNTTNSRGGMYETDGTTYTFSAAVSGNELMKHIAYDYDRDYKTAQAVVWSCVLKVDGTETPYNWTSVQNGVGEWEFTAPDFTTGTFAEYFEVDTAATKEDALVPSFAIKLKKTMPAGLSLTVRATSKHALGVNKANSKYYDGLGSDPRNIYYGEDTISPRETKLTQGLEITLEPYETGEVNVGMKGGLSTNVTFDFHDATDLRTGTNPNGTTAVYKEATDTVAITLGKDEKGSGKTGAEPYTFTIDVKVGGVTKTTITVHVCRIDEISIEIPKDPWHDDSGNAMGLPTYDFRARFNVSNGNIDDMKKVMKHQLQYKSDGTIDEAAVTRTLSSRITWELIDHNSTFYYKDSVICMAGIGAGNKGEIQGSYTTTYKKNGEEFYNVIAVKPARIEQDTNGEWYIKQVPEVDISLSKKDTDTGLPKGYELKVTIEALHPSGTNKTDTLYKSGVEASVSIFGEMAIETPTQVVYVEPGQGVNSTDASDKEMVVPIMVSGGEVYRMSATISGNSSSDTKLATYSGGNPYLAQKTTSTNNNSTWYLGLLIGEKETGDTRGRIQVHVAGYNTNDKEIASYDFELGVRRVDKVDVKLNGSNIGTVNKEGSTIKFEAYPESEKSGTAYYDKQEVNGATCRWETAGHGEYKEPSLMEWRMVIEGVEKPLSEWSDYVDKDASITTSVNASDHKALVSFKLKKALPNGTRIRAYSLHARGNNGKNEASDAYEKYNKSGKEYDEVYGEFVINDRINLADCGYERYNEQNYDLPGYENIPYYNNADTNWSKQQVFYRYRTVDGTTKGAWSQYYRTDNGSGVNAQITGPNMGAVFRTDTEYDLDCVLVVYNESEKKIYWPLDDETLLQTGMGFKENGYSLKDWDWQNKLTEEQKSFKCRQEYFIAKTELFIAPYPDPTRGQTANRQTIPARAQSAGTESSPIVVDGNGGGTQEKWFSVNMDPYAFCLHAFQGNFKVYVDKKTGSGWESINLSNMQNTEHWLATAQNPEITVGYTYGASGTYRLRAYIDGITWKKPSGDMFNPTYVTASTETMKLYDDSGIGTIYVKLE